MMEDNLIQKLIAIRRQIHQKPELGYQEFETAALISRELELIGVEYEKNIAKTGMIATIKKGEGPCIVLRADMDALPLQEKTNLPFASQVDHVMHACGHDVHTTMLLGAVHLLNKSHFNGCIKFVFQPSEESTNNDPEKKSGGQRIIESGLLKDAVAAIALHVHPLMEVGKIGFRLGEALACNGFFKIVIKGKYSHAAFPHLGTDAILIASNLIQSAQAIVSRFTSPSDPAVISFTKITGGVSYNITAGEVVLLGTIRAMKLEVYEQIIDRLRLMLQGISTSFSAEISIDFNLNYPSLVNDKSIHGIVENSLQDIFGKKNLIEMEPVLAGEDFAFYSRQIPSMFYFLGARAPNDEAFFLHHPQCEVNEACIPLGVNFLTSAALSLLENLSNKEDEKKQVQKKL